MAKCDYCGSTIIFGGKRDANGRFCNQKCQGRGGLLAFSRQIPEGTVAGRLARARGLLAKRLTRRGVVLSAGSIALALSEHAATACVPTSVAAATIGAGVSTLALMRPILGAALCDLSCHRRP